jgi:hypothetical protein
MRRHQIPGGALVPSAPGAPGLLSVSFILPIAALPTRSSKSAITEGLLMCSPRKAMIRDMTQDSDKPRPQARKSPDIQKAALEYLRILRSSNPGYDVKAAKSVVVMNRPH